MIPLAQINESRFWKYVNKSDGCWEWIGAKSHGYGVLGINGKSYRASRISWELINGTIPENQLCLHKCDNPSCVNPDHLYLGDYRDNINDMYNRERNPRNVNYWRSRSSYRVLSNKQINQIKELFNTGKYSKRELGKIFNTHESNIGRIIRNERRKKITNLEYDEVEKQYKPYSTAIRLTTREKEIVDKEDERLGLLNFSATIRLIIREWAELKQQQERDTKESKADHA